MLGNIAAVTPLLDGSAVGLLITGAVVAGALGVVAIGASLLIPRFRIARLIPFGGLLLAVPLLIVNTDARDLPTLAYVGFGLLAVAGAAVPFRMSSLVHGAAAIPGAALLAVDVPDPGRGLMLLIPLLVVATHRFEEGHDYEPGITTMCATIAGGGAFLTVPDTEHMALVAGAGVAVGLLVLADPRLALHMSRSVWVGAFVFSVALDGVGRATGVIGAIGALGLLLIDPVVRTNLSVHRGLLTYLPTSGARQQILAVAAIQTVLALFASRVAGLQMDPAIAIVLIAISSAATGFVLARRAESMP